MKDEKSSGAVGTCSEVVALLSDYIDGELSVEDKSSVQAHMAGCPNCERFLRSLENTVDWTRRVEIEEVPPEVIERLSTFLRARVRGTRT